MMCAFVVTNYKKQFFSVAVHMSFNHERLESKMRNLIIVKYDITRTELLSAQSLKSNCSVYVDTPRVILLATVFFIIQPDMRK